MSETGSIFEELALCAESGRLLDLDCGLGSFVHRALAEGGNAYGLGSRLDRIERASRVAPGRFQVGEQGALPFDDDAFDWVLCGPGLARSAPDELGRPVAEIRRVARSGVWFQPGRLSVAPEETDSDSGLASRAAGFHPAGSDSDRETWESRLLEAGFRKHPRYYRIHPYCDPEPRSVEMSLLLRKIPDDVLDRYPLESLRTHRELHMDMSREAGRRSDAHIVRYFRSARFIRANSVVLDAACGLGYGTEVLCHNSRAARVIGIDASATAIDYAQRSFQAGDSRLEFIEGRLPEALEDLDPGSVDFIACFETLEHLEVPDRFLAACHRVLSPGGRIVVSVPNDWSDGTGRDPNPHHLQVYTWDRLQAEMRRHFLVEAAFRQCASRAKVAGDWVEQGRVWAPASTESSTSEPAEWCLAVGIRSPIDTDHCDFRDGLAAPELAQYNPLAFARDYANPWIPRGLLNPASRAGDPHLLGEIAARVALGEAHGVADRKEPGHDTDHPETPLARNRVDRGAALAVIGYRLLERRAPWREVRDYFRDVDGWLESEGRTPHEIRWRVSLLFLKGRLLSQAGRRRRAIEAYAACGSLDAVEFSPVLATKTAEAWLRAADLYEGSNDYEAARRCRRRAVSTARDALDGVWPIAFEQDSGPPPFHFLELAQVLRCGAEGALHLNHRRKHAQSGFERETILRRLSDGRLELGVPREEPSASGTYSAPGTRVEPLSFSDIELVHANEWSNLSRQANEPTIVLHPQLPTDGPQPTAFVREACLSGRCVLMTASAVNPDPGNPGARLRIRFTSGPESWPEITFDLPPRQPVPIAVRIPDGVRQADLEIGVLARTPSSPIQYAAVRVGSLRLEG